MHINELKNEGLSREYSVTVPADSIQEKTDAQLIKVAGDVRLPGFRPGKVPMKILRQRFSKSVLGEVLEAMVEESSKKVLEENNLRPATQPKIEIEKFEDGGDLIFKMSVDCMPDIKPMDFSSVRLTRLVAKAGDKEIGEEVERIAHMFPQTEPVAEGQPAKDGDTVVLDYVGRIDGKAFPGGKGEQQHLQIGSGRFVPGFEEQLVGKKAGDSVTITVTFPKDYSSKDVAGKEAVFEVTVKEVRTPVAKKPDDDLAKALGLETLDQLQNQIRGGLEKDYANISRSRLKRELLDILHKGHDFDVPKGMVDREFNDIWTQYEKAKEEGTLDEEEATKSEKEAKSEFQDIAKRRVMLGLLLSEVGTKNNIQVTDAELQQAVMANARHYPGQEKQVVEMYRKNPQMLASLQAPLFEDKVVDFILEIASVTDKEVSVEELLRDPDEVKKSAPTKAQKASIKKASVKKKPGTKKTATNKSPAKKTAAKNKASE